MSTDNDQTPERSAMFVFLADLIDDLDHKQLTELLNYLALRNSTLRASIKGWRREKGLPRAE